MGLQFQGDSTIYAFEVTEEPPYCCPLSHHRCSSLHQGLSFLPKNKCDVASVEFASALRLTNNTIEPLSFTVPRIKVHLLLIDLAAESNQQYSMQFFLYKNANAFVFLIRVNCSKTIFSLRRKLYGNQL